MSTGLILAPALAVGVGLAAGYGVTHRRRDRRIHFVEKENLGDELDALDISLGARETCLVCGEVVEPEDVGALVREDGEYRAIHDRPSCLDSYDIE